MGSLSPDGAAPLGRGESGDASDAPVLATHERTTGPCPAGTSTKSPRRRGSSAWTFTAGALFVHLDADGGKSLLAALRADSTTTTRGSSARSPRPAFTRRGTSAGFRRTRPAGHQGSASARSTSGPRRAEGGRRTTTSTPTAIRTSRARATKGRRAPSSSFFGPDPGYSETELNDPRCDSAGRASREAGSYATCVVAQRAFDMHGNIHEIGSTVRPTPPSPRSGETSWGLLRRRPRTGRGAHTGRPPTRRATTTIRPASAAAPTRRGASDGAATRQRRPRRSKASLVFFFATRVVRHVGDDLVDRRGGRRNRATLRANPRGSLQPATGRDGAPPSGAGAGESALRACFRGKELGAAGRVAGALLCGLRRRAGDQASSREGVSSRLRFRAILRMPLVSGGTVDLKRAYGPRSHTCHE